ncbi:cobyrinate a,c-diamide synthase [Xenophilus sp. Marseille-Q4582]|uniref:cobyrinate a,c-diamide synthase n=1 Tax=Xenophilus sp. Marseille-Q4582 TaxID=2866600 RepID=UPI001CE41395|nr:cobyrinate a,c-diamide synthase [Xenophilus sp. Marseille-Q4582]
MRDEVRCAAVLVAAPASGQGKTTVAAALARLHARQGRRVRAFKSGPDFLDPQWLALATGEAVDALDLWMTGEADCRARLHAAARESELIVVEGVMGLFDGAPSAADLARRLGLPVLAVIDAGAMAGTFGALVHGLKTYEPGLPWAGVLANRVAGEQHGAMLQAALREPADWLGGLPRSGGAGADFALPQRHLGLIASAELEDALARIDAAADALAATPLGRRALADLPQVHFAAPPVAAPRARRLEGRRIAIARDAAFCFIYPANLAVLQQLGAQCLFFSPLAGDALPDCDALWLPGGYPELHAPALAARDDLRVQLRAHVAKGRPVWAECGGMMALFDALEGADGAVHTMWGLLPGRTVMRRRLAGLGPQQLAIGAHLLRGHTFHYSICQTPLPPQARSARPGQAPRADAGEALYVQGPVRASYFHAWFASAPDAVVHLFGGPAPQADAHG